MTITAAQIIERWFAVIVSEDEGSPDLGDPEFNVKAWMRKPRSWW
jgi:hypothetical protein